MTRGLFVVAILAVAGTAAADDQRVAELVKQGEEAARTQAFERAIELFKQADTIETHANHACLIGLAYTRLERWAQAEIFLGRCRARGNASDPAPTWLADVENELAAKLASLDVAAIELVVEPAGTVAKIVLSGVPPDEDFGPRTIHLRPGTHVVTVSAPGFAAVQKTIEIRDKSPQKIVVDLTPPKIEPPPPPPPPPTTDRRSSLGKWMLIGSGGAA